MTSVAVTLAEWAAGLEPDRDDLDLAHRSLLDTVAVTLAARDHRVTRLAAAVAAGRRALGGGRARARLRRPAHAVDHARQRGVRADGPGDRRRRPRLPGRGRGDGPARHGAGLAALLGRAGTPPARPGHRPRPPEPPSRWACPPSEIAAAMALAVPAAGGVQRAFGTDAKSLQVGFAVDGRDPRGPAAAAGAQADPAALDGGSPWWAATPGAVGPVRTGSPERAGDQALPVLLRAAAPDQRAARARPEPNPAAIAPDRAAHPGGHGARR